MNHKKYLYSSGEFAKFTGINKRTLHYVGVFLCYGIVILGLICNLVAMKYYPLTKEKMEEIQTEIARIKAQNLQNTETA